MLLAVRKDYDNIKGNLGKIKAAAADIGWFLTQQIYLQSLTRDEKVTLTVNTFRSGQDFLAQFLADAGNETWFTDIEQRAAQYSPSLGTVRGAFGKLSEHHLLFAPSTFIEHRDLCIELSLLCEYLEENIKKEIEETKQPLLRLL